MSKPAQTDAASWDAGGPLLSERQWLWLSRRLPIATEKRGRPPANNRAVIEGILWVATTRLAWRDLPPCYGKWSSVYRRFARWSRDGVITGLLAHVRPFECGPAAPDDETRALYIRLVALLPLARRLRCDRPTRPGTIGAAGRGLHHGSHPA